MVAEYVSLWQVDTGLVIVLMNRFCAGYRASGCSQGFLQFAAGGSCHCS